MSAGEELRSDPALERVFEQLVAAPSIAWEQQLDELCSSHGVDIDRVRSFIQTLRGVRESERPGDELPRQLGEYRLLRKLGEGGMGVVYLAEQPRLARRVAVKIVRPEHLMFPMIRERFLREVEAVAKLRHPGIVSVHTVGEADGVPFFAMDYVAGCSLADVIESLADRPPQLLKGRDLRETVARLSPPSKATRDGEGLPEGDWPRVCFGLVRRILEALEHAHARGIVHRDVKPSNVMLTPRGDVVLLDFGLAVCEGTVPITRPGDMLGSLPYSAPEQLQGGEVDQRTDVWAAGAILYELLTLERPFAAPDARSLATRILTREPRDPRRLCPGLTGDAAAVVSCALEKDIDRRYRSAAQVADDLRSLLEVRPVSVRPASVWTRAVRWAKREPLSAALVFALCVTVPVLAYVGGLWAASSNVLAAGREKILVDRVERLIGRGYLALGARQGDLAARAFDEALALDPSRPEIVAGSALAQLRCGRWDAAVRLVEEHSTTLHDARAWARLRRMTGQSAPPPPEPETALDFFLAGVEHAERAQDVAGWRLAEASFLEAIVRTGFARPLFHIRYAQAAKNAGSQEAATRAALALAELWPRESTAWVAVGFALADSAPERALGAFHEAVRLAPQDPIAQTNLGVMLMRAGEDAAALTACRKAVAQDSDTGLFHFNLGTVLHHEGDLEGAVAAYRRAVELDPRLTEAHRNLAIALYDQGNALKAAGDTRRAAEAFENALQHDPELALAHYNLATTLRAAGDRARAIGHFRQAARFAPKLYAAHFNLANNLLQAGLPEEAVRSYRAAAALRDDDPDLHVNHAHALRELGDGRAAVASLRRAVALAPKDAGAHELLVELLRAAGDETGAGAEIQRFQRTKKEEH